MIAKFKAKLRAWLIDLVREAIRLERGARHPFKPERSVFSDFTLPPVNFSAVAEISASPVHIEPSFEQLQAEALAAQEKFYEPERA